MRSVRLAWLVVLWTGCTVRQDLGPGGVIEGLDGGVPPACAGNTDCFGCIYDECQWCADTATCGPVGGGWCAGASADTDELCFELECSVHTDCTSCLADTPCTWCDVEGGVCTESTDCPLHYWYLSGDECPPPNRCSTHWGCDDCIAEPGCGWCVDHDECMAGWDAPIGDTLCFDGFYTDSWSCGG